ncbi:MAG: putative toxin-antitoxin system toxin component, PIN family [Prevotella sp.]|nr:putative toxin-antitoxin system toxin component, PIN family [Prevotella sp.]
MARLVLDTNSLIQCIARTSKFHDLWISILDGRNNLCVTTEILSEYAEILERKTSAKFASIASDLIANNRHTVLVTSYFKFNLITSDPDDNKFVDCAIAANAKFIVTEDSDYNVLKDLKFPRVEIIKLDDIIQQI